MEAIVTENLTKIYNGKKVVNEVSLRVKKGGVFGFLGKNGAGKSTFINIITGLCHANYGSYSLNCKDVKKSVGVMPDYSSLYSDLTGREHIKYFSNLLNKKMSKNEIINLLNLVGLDNGLDLKVKKYSFGMKKKLGIAQALINDPEILFLDEPTSGVDANSILSIHNLITDISDKGTTIFITSHNLNEIEKLCNEIAIMDKGSIKIQGTIDEIKEQYRKNLTLNLKHDSISTSTLDKMNNKLSESSLPSLNVEHNNTKSYIQLNSKEEINIILELFINSSVNILDVHINEPSLEEIFVETAD